MDTLAPDISTTTVTIGGLATNYYEAGQAKEEPFLLLHGMSASADTFREMMLDLAEDYHIIAPDIPGFGYSDNTRPYTFPHLTLWLKGLVDELAIGTAHIGGHSFGGALAVNYALDQPQDVQSLTLLAPSVLRPGKYPQWLRRFAQSRVSEWVLGLGVHASRLMLQRQMRAAFYDPSQFEDTLWTRRQRDYELARASASVLRASALHDMRADLYKIEQHSCIIWGNEDPVLEPHDAAVLNELMPQSRTELHMLSNCGHIPHIEKREQVVDIVRQFLATT